MNTSPSDLFYIPSSGCIPPPEYIIYTREMKFTETIEELEKKAHHIFNHQSRLKAMTMFNQLHEIHPKIRGQGQPYPSIEFITYKILERLNVSPRILSYLQKGPYSKITEYNQYWKEVTEKLGW